MGKANSWSNVEVKMFRAMGVKDKVKWVSIGKRLALQLVYFGGVWIGLCGGVCKKKFSFYCSWVVQAHLF